MLLTAAFTGIPLFVRRLYLLGSLFLALDLLDAWCLPHGIHWLTWALLAVQVILAFVGNRLSLARHLAMGWQPVSRLADETWLERIRRRLKLYP